MPTTIVGWPHLTDAERLRRLLIAYAPDWPICQGPRLCSDCERKASRIAGFTGDGVYPLVGGIGRLRW
jgi:hypothetical protein